MKKISIVLPCYNHGKYVADAIKSVLNQTYTNFELFVFDNGSIDNSWEEIQKFDDPRLKKLKIMKNDLLEVKKQFIQRATGKYFAIMHSDDIWKQQKLEKQMELFETNKNARICFTWSKLMEIDKEMNEIKEKEEWYCITNKSEKEWWEEFLTRANHISCPSMVCEREIYIKYFEKLYPFRQIADFYCWMKILEETKLYIVEEILVIQRKHNFDENKNESYRTHENVSREAVELKYVVYKIIDEMPDNVFLRNFCCMLENENELKHIDVMCQKFLFFVKRNRGFSTEHENAIRYYNTYFDYEENGHIFYQYLSDKYGFSRNDFFEYEAEEDFSIKKNRSRFEKWSKLVNIDFSTVKYPSSISIYGCGEIGKAFCKKIMPYCHIEQFIDKTPKIDMYKNIPVVTLHRAKIDSESVIVVIPTYDLEDIIMNIKAIYPDVTDKNIVSFEDFIKTGKIIDADF